MGFGQSSHDERIVASIIIHGAQADCDGTRLQFFNIHESRQGQSIGKQLMRTAINFCNYFEFKGKNCCRATF